MLVISGIGLVIAAYFFSVNNSTTEISNSTVFNQMGNFTPCYVNTTKTNGSHKEISITQQSIGGGHNTPYVVREGSCAPNKQGHLKFATDTEILISPNNFSYMFGGQWLNGKSTVSGNITADFSNGATLSLYLFGYNCFLQILQCFQDEAYDYYTTIPASTPSFSVSTPVPDYFFMVIRSEDQQVYARWTGESGFMYFSDDVNSTEVCKGTITDNFSCKFKVDNGKCYFIGPYYSNISDPVFYQYNLNITTQQRKPLDMSNTWFLLLITMVAVFILTLCLFVPSLICCMKFCCAH